MWSKICDISDFQQVLDISNDQPVLVFKHSTRCSISSVARMRLESDHSITTSVIPYYLDVIECRPLSNMIATHFEVRHESPQALLIYQGECIFDESHLGISSGEIIEAAQECRGEKQWRTAPQ